MRRRAVREETGSVKRLLRHIAHRAAHHIGCNTGAMYTVTVESGYPTERWVMTFFVCSGCGEWTGHRLAPAPSVAPWRLRKL